MQVLKSGITLPIGTPQCCIGLPAEIVIQLVVLGFCITWMDTFCGQGTFHISGEIGKEMNWLRTTCMCRGLRLKAALLLCLVAQVAGMLVEIY